MNTTSRRWIAATAAALLACGGKAGEVTCAPGLRAQGSACVPADGLSFTCGTGTHLSGSACVADGLVSCGAGTWNDGGVCRPTSVPAYSCGAGTHLSGTTCVPDAGLACGAGTHLSGSACAPDTLVTCGAGTHASGTVCLPDPTMTCGTGTHLDATTCVADAVLTCGPGTHPESGRCVRDASTTFEVRIPVQSIPADGFSRVPLLVLGRAADGSPSTADVVLRVSPPGAGTLTPAAFPLGVMGSTSWFVPCSSTEAGCTGTFQIDVSLATDPLTVVATTGPLQLVEPVGVGSAAACLLGGSIFSYQGNYSIFDGTRTVPLGSYMTSASVADDVRLSFFYSHETLAMWQDLEFSSPEFGVPLAVQVYEDATGAAFASPGHPGMKIGGDGCNTITGRFQIEELVWTSFPWGRALTRFTATFEQYCDGGPSVVRGCVHLE